MKNFSLLFIILLLGGCAMGRTTSYNGEIKSLQPHYVIPPVSIGVVDNRPYVLDGGAPPTYVGTLRSLARVPYYMKTASGKPLADVLQSMIARSLNAKGYKVEDKVKIPVGTPERESIKILSATGKESFLLTLKEWKHHIYINPFFEYDAKMSVITPNGDVLASTTQKGMIEIGKEKKVLLGDAMSIALNKLFNDQKIDAVFSGDQYRRPVRRPSPVIKDPTVGNKTVDRPKKCTTDQVLKMKEMGISDSQIKAACK